MEVGSEFIPYRVFTGCFIPTGLMQYQGINASAKMVWARLARFAGQRGIAYPSNPKIAEECGMSERCVRRSLEELEKQGFIIRKGTIRQCVVWGFLLHQSLVEERSNVPESETDSSTEPRSKAQFPRSECPGSEEKDETTVKNAGEPRSICPRTPVNLTYKESHEETLVRESCSLTKDSTTLVDSAPPDHSPDPLLKEIRDAFNDLYIPTKPPPGDWEELRDLIDEYDADLVKSALGEAARYHKRRRAALPYIRAIVKKRFSESERWLGYGADAGEYWD